MKRYPVWIGASLVFAILVVSAEIYLRVEYGAGHPVLAVRDRDCGYLLKPNQDVTRFGHHHVFINQQGMRSAEIAPKAGDVLRVMFVGDSVTYGSTQVDQTEIFSERIHRDLQRLFIGQSRCSMHLRVHGQFGTNGDTFGRGVFLIPTSFW